MDWRTLLNYDLRQHLPGYRALPPPVNPAAANHLDGYPAAVRKKILDPMWKGPQYTIPRQKQLDLLFVLEQIRLCARAKLPLHQGLEAAARNELQFPRKAALPLRANTALGLLAACGVALFIFLVLARGPLLASEVAGTAFAVAATVGAGIADSVLARQRRAAVCGSLVRAMNHGLSLSEAMARLERFFPRPVVSLVEAGEMSDRLAETTEQLNREALDRYFKNQQLAGWLAYIGMVALVQLAVIGFLLYKVAPVLLEIKQEIFGDLLPGDTSETPRETPFPLPLPSIETLGNPPPWLLANLAALMALILLIGFGLAWRSLALRAGWVHKPGSALDMHIPVYRRLLALQNLGGAASLLSLLLRAGVPLDRALESVIDSGLYFRYADWFRQIRDRVRGGDAFAAACADVPQALPVPASFHDTIAMSEHLGRLEDGLTTLGDRYSADLETRITRSIHWAQVGSILLLAYFVLSMEVGVLGTLVDLADALIT